MAMTQNQIFFPDIMIIIFIFFAGAIIGSFLNVCISRLPENKSVVSPKSACPDCGAFIKWYHNIPLLSYILLKGHCRYCGKPISIRYFLVEFLTGAGLASLYYFFSPTPVFFFHAILLFLLIIITFIDIEHQLILDKVNAVGLTCALLFPLIIADHTIKDAFFGMVTGGGFLIAVALVGDFIFRKESMGRGDIKMAAMVGCFLGWYGIVVSLLYAFIAGAIIGIIARIYHREYLPFAPFIAFGT
ncbi:prepilin peptidase, partial [candidate division KSB1 bacterium]|nr:prepilin peptidase [candidate division KSB1 bacterium]